MQETQQHDSTQFDSKNSTGESNESGTQLRDSGCSRECFHCGDDGSYLITALSGSGRGLCERCWVDRHSNGLEEALLDEHILSPRLVSELQADFYDRTDHRDGGEPMTESLAAYLGDGAQATTLRVGSATELAAHAGVVESRQQFYDGVKWPSLDDGDRSLYAAAVYLPCEADVPLYFGVFVAAKTTEQFDGALVQTGRELHAAKHGPGGA